MTDESNPDAHLCITASMDGWRTCTIRDEHQLVCDGRRYRWNKQARRWDDIGECTGCLPKEANHGQLCGACYHRAELALVQWTVDRASILGSIDRAVSHDNGGIRSASAGHIPIPATRLAVDEIDRYLRGYPGRLDYWVTTPAGAEAAVRFARAATTALRTHELEEKPHTVQHVRCPGCEYLNLVWTPPGRARGKVTITCQNSSCGRVLTQDEIETEAMHQEGVTEPVVEPAGPVTLDHNLAEPFDPERPEHEHFDVLSTRLTSELRAIAEELEVPRFRSLPKPELISAIRAAQQPELEEAS